MKIKLLLLTVIVSVMSAASVSAQTAEADRAAARAPLENYLRGHATGDPEFMRKAFHTEGSLIFIRDGKHMTRSFADYVAVMTDCIVNLEYVERVESWFNRSQRLFLRGRGEPLTVSRRHAARLKEKFG